MGVRQQMRSPGRLWCGLLLLLGIFQCTLPQVDMRGYPCDQHDQCGSRYQCTDGYCGGRPNKEDPPKDAEERHPENAPESGPEPDIQPDTEPKVEPKIEPQPEPRPEPKPEPDTPSEPMVHESDAGAREWSCPEQGYEGSSPDQPPTFKPLSSHVKWVRSAGGEDFYQYQLNAPLGVSSNELYIVGGYRFFKKSPQNLSAPTTQGMIARYDAQGTLQWVESATITASDSRINDISASPDQTLIITGMIHGPTSFGTTRRSPSFGIGDAFVAKYDPKKKAFAWVTTLGGAGYDEGSRVLVDQQGAIFASGTLRGSSLRYSTSGTISQLLPSQWATPKQSPDGYVIKLDTNGKLLWSRLWGSATGYERPWLYPDHKNPGALYVSISYNGQLYDEKDQIIATSQGTSGMVLLKLDKATGQVQRQMALDTFGKLGRLALTQDPSSGDLLLAGSYEGTWKPSLYCGLAQPFSSQGGQDAVIVRMTQQGQIKWLRSWGGLKGDRFADIHIDGSGRLFAVGHFIGTFQMDGVTLASAQPQKDPNCLIAQLSLSDGKLLGAWGLTGSKCWAFRLRSDSGGLLLSGIFSGTVQFGNGPLSAQSQSDNFLLRFVP